MRRLIASVQVTLDGVMGAPEEWALPFVDEESERRGVADLAAADALLLGRVTYEGFLGYWPSATDPEAERMNAMPKYVVSKSLRKVEWNSTLIAGDAAIEIRRLKSEPGGDILLLASADLANSLRAENLIDEYRIWVVPTVHGRGKRYFEGEATPELQLTDVTTLSSGIVVLTYTAKPSLPA
jgi:dihydrofolate reductase